MGDMQHGSRARTGRSQAIDHPVFAVSEDQRFAWDILADVPGSDLQDVGPAGVPASAISIHWTSRERRDMASRIIQFFDITCKSWLGQAEAHAPELSVLLDLFINEEDGRTVTVGDACIAARVPHTTALRAVDHLVRLDLLIRYPDPADCRRKLLSLTTRSRIGVIGYIDQFLANRR